MKYIQVYTFFLMLVFYTSCKGQVKTNIPKESVKPGNQNETPFFGPKLITRNIIQDRNGNIWIAAFDGVFRYDGKSFTNIISKISSSHFFSVLEDKKGNLWFGSIGSGVYKYDGKSFRNFTRKDGLSGSDVNCIYEDKTGNLWFGTEGGITCYNGKSFRNFTTTKGLSLNNANSIIEDEKGRFWFATGGNTFVYDGKTISVFTREGNPFTNVRSIIEDKQRIIWLGGNDGLWRYDGNTFTNIDRNFVGYVYEDKTGNIWTSSENSTGQDLTLPRYDGKPLSYQNWMLSRYDEKTQSGKKPTAKEIISRKGMICGILEASDGSIWFGADNGAYRYDGNIIKVYN